MEGPPLMKMSALFTTGLVGWGDAETKSFLNCEKNSFATLDERMKD